MTVGLETERQIEAFEECRSSQAEERDRHTAPQPPLIQTGPTTVQRKIERNCLCLKRGA